LKKFDFAISAFTYRILKNPYSENMVITQPDWVV